MCSSSRRPTEGIPEAERHELNLDAYSETQAKTKSEESDSTVDHRIRETYTWLLVPGQQEPTAEVTCTAVRMQGQELLAELPHPRLQDLRARERVGARVATALGVRPAEQSENRRDLLAYQTIMTVSELLHEKRAEILRIAEKHGARHVRVFGSAARGDATEGSDIDLLVDVGEQASAWFPTALVEELEHVLGRPVDVVTEDGLYWLIKRRILNEARPL